MASRYRPRSATTPPQGRRAAVRQRERRIQRWVLVLFAVVIAAVVAIPAYGYVATFVLPPRHVVVTVGGVKHTLGEIVKRSRADMLISNSNNLQIDAATLPFNILDTVTNEEILRQNATSLGVMVSLSDTDAEIKRLHYPTPPAGQQVDQVSLDREYQNNLRQYLNLTQLTMDEYRGIVQANLLQAGVSTKLSDRVPAAADQVDVSWVRVADQSIATEIQTHLSNGETLDSLARIYMQQDRYADANGHVGLVPKGAFPFLDTLLFPDTGSVQLNKVSDSIPGDDGFTYFVLVNAGPQTSQISDAMRQVLKNHAVVQWLADQRGGGKVQVSFTSSDYSWVEKKIQELVPTGAAPTPTPIGG